MRWRAILIGIVLEALLFLVFAIWIAVTQFDHGLNPSMAVIALQVLEAPLF